MSHVFQALSKVDVKATSNFIPRAPNNVPVSEFAFVDFNVYLKSTISVYLQINNIYTCIEGIRFPHFCQRYITPASKLIIINS